MNKKDDLALMIQNCGSLLQLRKGGGHLLNDNKSLAHTTWNCKYHIVYMVSNKENLLTFCNDSF